MQKRIPFAVFIVLGALSAQMAAQNVAAPTHGTVNIVLANKNGAVVVTDSRLSYNGSARGDGPKLFRLDSTTICAIAGFYSDQGPTAPTGSFPAATTIPYMVTRYQHQLGGRNPLTLDQKLDIFAGVFQFELGFVAAARQAASQGQSSPSVSQITLIGFEKSKIVILSEDLVPHIDSGVLTYLAKNKLRQEVASEFVTHLAGITDVAATTLKNPDVARSSKDPILHFMGNSLVTDGGANLTVHDLALIARKLASLTASRYPNEVGGPLETAELADGKVLSFDSIPSDDNIFQGMRMRFPGMKAHHTSSAISPIQPPDIVLVEDGEFDHTSQVLDNLIIVSSKFEGSHLRYNGSPRTYFGSDNLLVDTDLTLGPGVSQDSAFVKNMHSLYPDLPIKSVDQ